MTRRVEELSRDRLASDQITETPAFVDPGCRHGAQHGQEPVMATVHVGADTDPHRASLWRAPPKAGFFPPDAVGHPRRLTQPLHVVGESATGSPTRGPSGRSGLVRNRAVEDQRVAELDGGGADLHAVAEDRVGHLAQCVWAKF